MRRERAFWSGIPLAPTSEMRILSLVVAACIAGCAHPADREPRFFSAGSGSGHHVGYDQHGEAIYGSGKPWRKGDKPMRR